MDFLESDFNIEGVNSVDLSNLLMQIYIVLTQGHLINHMSSSVQSISNLILFSLNVLYLEMVLVEESQPSAFPLFQIWLIK